MNRGPYSIAKLGAMSSVTHNAAPTGLRHDDVVHWIAEW